MVKMVKIGRFCMDGIGGLFTRGKGGDGEE